METHAKRLAVKEYTANIAKIKDNLSKEDDTYIKEKINNLLDKHEESIFEFPNVNLRNDCIELV